jgi:UDP-N-acetylglucosamine diphosphorylase / glucose-1-phosphate thymidylyltransferase / UDP-N-acetylgalactosamine diphosphorylase / glucosamine-1-phosphate N-acetyltransferase / galactosamine-1-phosphate N-acetyltransferase
MNIVLPLAGAGSRFAEVGYTVPKPFIDVLGKPMIRRVMDNIGWSGKYYLLTQKAHKEVFAGAMLGCDKEWQDIKLDGVTEGAACTVLKAKSFIDNCEMLTIANSDQVIDDENWLCGAIDHFFQQEADCGIVCFLYDNPAWSYAKVEKGRVVEVAEKRVISNICTSGIYWFKHGEDFVRAAESMISKNIRTNNEFYVAPSINELILEGKKVVPYMVNMMYGLGNPEDLATYIRGHQ